MANLAVTMWMLLADSLTPQSLLENGAKGDISVDHKAEEGTLFSLRDEGYRVKEKTLLCVELCAPKDTLRS